MILKLALINRHVDLSHIQSVGEAYFDDRMGSGGWFVGFTIDFLLQDQPRRYEWRAEECGGVKFEDGRHWVQYEAGPWSTDPHPDDFKRDNDYGQLVCVKTLNERILRDIVQPWKDFKATFPR